MVNLLAMKCNGCGKEIKATTQKVSCILRLKNESIGGFRTIQIAQFHLKCFQKITGVKTEKR